MSTTITGKAHVYPIDNIDTDRIIPGKYTKTLDTSELASHVLEDLDPAFSKTVSVGDVLVAGGNFGCGSSREQAPIALKAAGVSAVVAKSFARIFFRNAINIGLLVIESPEHEIQNGSQVTIDIENGFKLVLPSPTMMIHRRLKQALPAVKVLFLTMHEEEGMLLEALSAGGDGYLIKRADEAEILQAIRAVLRGDLYVHPAMTRALLGSSEPAEHLPEPVEPLTRREIDVLRLLAKGNTNRQIAERLALSIRTIESHRANLMGKLGLTSRVELVTYAEEHGLL